MSSDVVRPIELPSPAPDAARETDRTEPGTWREIIARFEREVGPLSEPSEQETVLPTPVHADAAPSEPAPGDSGDDLESPLHSEEVAGGAPLPGAGDTPDPKRVLPGEPTYFDEPMPWEVEGMTTPGYMPPPSIHDAQHGAWPVDVEDGDTVPAWSDELGPASEDAPLDDVESYGEINELLLDDEVPVDPWDVEPEPDEVDSRSDFPLDAFIVPAGVHHLPTGYDAAVAQRVAHRLDEMARRLRHGGLATLGSTDSVDELSRVLAAIVTGYVAHTD